MPLRQMPIGSQIGLQLGEASKIVFNGYSDGINICGRQKDRDRGAEKQTEIEGRKTETEIEGQKNRETEQRGRTDRLQ